MKPGAASPEAALVTALAAGDADGTSRALASRPDEEKAGDLAAAHQVDALCWWMWKSFVAGEADLPPALHKRLRLAYLHHLLRNEALGNDLEALRQALAAEGVDALCFKGPWVAFQAYPDPGARPVSDIDLGIREADFEAAVAALGAAGWKISGPLPRTGAEALAQSHFQGQLRFRARGRRPVELHFRMVNVGPPGPEETWVRDGARQLVDGSDAIRVPGPEAMLLHLLLHAGQHGFAVLRLLHDIRWTLEADRASLDTTAFHRLVRRLRCRPACYHALELAAEMAGARPDGSLLDPLRPSAARRRLFALVWRFDAVRRLEAPRRRMKMEAPLFYLLEMGRWRDKALYAARVLAAAGGLK